MYELKVNCMSHKQSIQMPMTTTILQYKVQVQLKSSIICRNSRELVQLPTNTSHYYYSTFQVGCSREIGSNGEIGKSSIDAKITQTIVNIQDSKINMVSCYFKLSTNCPIALKQPT